MRQASKGGDAHLLSDNSTVLWRKMSEFREEHRFFGRRELLVVTVLAVLLVFVASIYHLVR
jgi:hypothetical protein